MQFISLADANQQQQPPAVFPWLESFSAFQRETIWLEKAIFASSGRGLVCRLVRLGGAVFVMMSWIPWLWGLRWWQRGFQWGRKTRQASSFHFKVILLIWIHICALGLFYWSKRNTDETVPWINHLFRIHLPTHTPWLPFECVHEGFRRLNPLGQRSARLVYLLIIFPFKC